jgi:hypothetical protein
MGALPLLAHLSRMHLIQGKEWHMFQECIILLEALWLKTRSKCSQSFFYTLFKEHISRIEECSIFLRGLMNP